MGGEIILLNCCKWLQINRPFFQAVTARLRSEATLPIKRIAARVQIGTAKGAKSVAHLLAQSQDQRKTAQAPSNHAPRSNSNLRFGPFHATKPPQRQPLRLRPLGAQAATKRTEAARLRSQAQAKFLSAILS